MKRPRCSREVGSVTSGWRGCKRAASVKLGKHTVLGGRPGYWTLFACSRHIDAIIRDNTIGGVYEIVEDYRRPQREGR